jgi:hypothetical protein
MSSPPLFVARKSAWSWAVLGLIALAGSALRAWQIRESLWLDELHTAWCAMGSLADVAPRAAIGNQSPLFYWFEWLLVRLLGPDEVALRLVSVLAGSLLPVAMFALCRRWGQANGVGLLAAALVVIDPLSIFFATEARPYALVQLIAVLHVGVATELFARPSPVLRFAFVAGAGLLLHLHYTAALLIAAELSFWSLMSWMQSSSVRYRWPSFATDMLLIALLFSPAAGHLVAIFQRRENWNAFVQSRSLWAPWEMLELLPWSTSSFVLLVAIAALATPLATPQAAPRWIALCWFFVPACLAWLATASGTARLFFPRYLAASMPAAILLTAMCADVFSRRWSRIAIGTAILAAAVWTSRIPNQFLTDGRVVGYRTEDWRGAIAWLNPRLQDRQYPVFVASGLIEADGLRGPHEPLLEEYCLFPVTSLYPLATDRRNLVPLPFRDPGRRVRGVQNLIDERGGAWFIIRGRQSSARSAARNWQTSEFNSFGNVHVFKVSTDLSTPLP